LGFRACKPEVWRRRQIVKDIVILGGPNGAGKTTAARELLPGVLGIREFVNADEIARGLSPFNEAAVALAAGRLMLKRMDDLVAAGESFAFETTCAGRAYLPLLNRCRADGWRVTLLFLSLSSPETALARVARRVSQGGHAIPPDVIVRRYWKGLANMLRFYLPLADVAAIYDNDDAGRILIAERNPGEAMTIIDAKRWAIIEKVGS
jgi:predicted ABC-type ATPase